MSGVGGRPEVTGAATQTDALYPKQTSPFAAGPSWFRLMARSSYYGTTVPVEGSVKAVECCLRFDTQLDVGQALERAFRTRIESGAIKTDKSPQELVRLYYRKLG